ncbi:MAG: cobaltochelatase subunit CobN [Thermacetogeniaceae bacterium]
MKEMKKGVALLLLAALCLVVPISAFGEVWHHPGKDTYATGLQLANALIKKYQQEAGYPTSVCAMVWGKDASGQEGPMVSFVLAMLGVRPVWDAQGNVVGLALIPLQGLGRPRIDVTVITTGQFRDLSSDQIGLLDRAFRMALAASYQSIVASYPSLQPALDAALESLGSSEELAKGNEPLSQNYVAKNWVLFAQTYVASGKNPAEAGELAITRVYAPRANSFGCGISFENPEKDTGKLAERFLASVCYSYSGKKWGEKNPELLKGLLQTCNVLFHCRSNSPEGIFDQDGAPLEYTYLLGISASLEMLNAGRSQAYVGEGSGAHLEGEDDLLLYNSVGGSGSSPAGDGGAGTGAAIGGSKGEVSGASAGAAALNAQPRQQPARATKPQTERAHLRYLAEKGTGGGADSSDQKGEKSGGKQNSQGGRVFEVSVASASNSMKQFAWNVYLVGAALGFLFFYGSFKKYKKILREAVS